jgi:hypothetical protein
MQAALKTRRKRQQALHPGLTITDMYNVLEKLRKNEELAPKDHQIHEQGLVSVLRQIHDDLESRRDMWCSQLRWRRCIFMHSWSCRMNWRR